MKVDDWEYMNLHESRIIGEGNKPENIRARILKSCYNAYKVSQDSYTEYRLTEAYNEYRKYEDGFE